MKDYIFFFLIILMIVGIYVGLQPYLERREVDRIVAEILDGWQTDDFAKTIPHWKVQPQSPPIYGLQSYEITKKIFGKKTGRLTAQISVILSFPPGNLLPSGKEWVFEMESAPRIGWQVIDFYPTKQNKVP